MVFVHSLVQAFDNTLLICPMQKNQTAGQYIIVTRRLVVSGEGAPLCCNTCMSGNSGEDKRVVATTGSLDTTNASSCSETP